VVIELTSATRSRTGKEHLPDVAHAGNLSMTSSTSNMGSHQSLHSDTSEHTQNSGAGVQADNPEALEVAKQQKDILEQGIEM